MLYNYTLRYFFGMYEVGYINIYNIANLGMFLVCHMYVSGIQQLCFRYVISDMFLICHWCVFSMSYIPKSHIFDVHVLVRCVLCRSQVVCFGYFSGI